MKSPLTFFQGIVLVIVLSFIGLIVLIIFSKSLDFGLVEENYYEKDLKYQEQINRIELAKSLSEPVEIQYLDNVISIVFPKNFNYSNVNGKIHLFRPSNPDLDIVFPIKLNDKGKQLIDISELKYGSWIVKLEWMHEGLEYYTEKRIFIND